MEIKNIALVSKRDFYDTTWDITTDAGTVHIRRDESETLDSMTKLVNAASSIENISALDMRSRILYD